MQQFNYEVFDRQGRRLTGQAEADSAAEVVRRLTGDGHTVVDVSERRTEIRIGGRRRLRAQDLTVAFHELATLLESGVSLGDAILAQGKGTRHPALAAGFTAIGKALTQGENFLGALRASGLPLPDYAFHLVEAGELSGELAAALRQAVGQMEYDQKVAGEFKSALTYPAILVTAGTAAVFFVFVFVVPQFSNLLEQGNDLPLLAEVVLRTGAWFNENALLVAAGAAALAAMLTALFRRPAAQQRCMDGLARLPLLSDWLSEADTAKWASVMSAMLASRVELMDALGLAARGVRISRRRAGLKRAAADVRGGVSLAEALEKQDALTPTGYNLVRVGEQSGQLAQMLRSLATLYEQNSTRRMKRFLNLIEPLAILLIGGFLGSIMIGVILAMTSVNEGVL